MSLNDLYNVTVDIERVTETSDGMGGRVRTWSALFSDVPCRIEPLGGSEVIMYDKRTAIRTHFLYCDVRDFTEKDRVNQGGRLFEILAVVDPDLMHHHLEVDLRQAEGLD